MTKKTLITKEMLEDFPNMSYEDFCIKYKVSLRIPLQIRRKTGLPSFLKKHGLREHKFINDVEHKWCGSGHWEPVSNFGVHSNRHDKLRGICKLHEGEHNKTRYIKNDGASIAREWRKTPGGRKSLRTTWRKSSAQKKDAYVLWNRKIENISFKVFGRCCAYCKTKLTMLTVEFDHIVPITAGGKTHPNNMVPCCTPCNHGMDGKFERNVIEWLTSKFGEKIAISTYKNIRKKLKLVVSQI